MLFKSLLLIIFLIPLPSQCRPRKKTFTIMLDPAGDAKNVGRILYSNFERGATLQFAQQLKQQIMQRYPRVEVILTRTAGETLEILQGASFANRLNVDLYISLNFYKEADIKPKVFLFYFRNQTFFNCFPTTGLHFYPYHEAYTINFNKTKKCALLMQKWLQRKEYKHYFDCTDAIGIPFRPLVGILPPAIGIEIGIKKSGWDVYTAPIVGSLKKIIYEQ